MRVTYCSAAAISQTYANMFEIWHTDTSEVHVVVRKSVRNEASAMEDSQTKAYCKHSTLAYSTKKPYKHITVTSTSPAGWNNKVEQCTSYGESLLDQIHVVTIVS